jgi:AcrR family transcriptional regulator
MGVKDRRARHKQLLRQQILDAARELLVHEGYDQLSMRKVAERIDYSPTAIYLHFKDKQELVFSLCEESFAKLVRELETLPDEFPDPLVRLRKGMERYIMFGLKNPNHYLPAFVLPPPADLDPKRRQAMVSTESNSMRAFACMHDTIAEGVKAKKLKKVDPDVAARSTWAAIHGITSLLIVHQRFPWGDKQRVIESLIDSVVDGLKRS